MPNHASQGASKQISAVMQVMPKSKLAYLSCHLSSSKSSKIIISAIILPRSWKSHLYRTRESSSCTKGCSVEWESRSKTGAQLSCSTSAMPTKPKHRQTRALGIACHAPELVSPSQQQNCKHELEELHVMPQSLRAPVLKTRATATP